MPSLLKQIIVGLRALIRPRTAEAELTEELHASYAHAVDAKIAEGIARDVWRDIAFAARVLRRAPAFTIAAVSTLAVAIAVTTTMFSVVDAVVLDPLPYSNPDRLVVLWTDDPVHGNHEEGTSYLTYEDWRVRNHVFADMAIVSQSTTTLGDREEPERVDDALTSANLFSLLGVSPAIGRAFTEAEARAGEHVAVLSDGLWRRRFGGDRRVIGRTVTLDGAPTRIIGVMPPEFFFPTEQTQLWLPSTLLPQWPVVGTYRFNDWWSVVARLRPAVTLVQSRSEMSAIGAQLAREFPPPPGEDFAGFAVNVVSLREQITGAALPVILLMLLSAVALVPLIACVNLANLVLVRGAARTREFSIRSALGAGRSRLMTQQMAEAALISVTAAAVGVGASVVALPVVRRLAGAFIPRLPSAHVDAATLWFALAVAFMCMVLFGLAPATMIARRDAMDVLRSGGKTAAMGMTRNAFVVAQCALAVALLFAAGVLVRSLDNVLTVKSGVDAAHALIMHVNLGGARDEASPGNVLTPMLARVGAAPGVRAVGAIDDFIQRRHADLSLVLEGRDAAPTDGPLIAETISPSFFSAVRAPVLQGDVSLLRAGDNAAIAVNRAFVRRYLPSGNPIGRRVRRPQAAQWSTIVAVVGDMHRAGLEKQPIPEIYEPGFGSSMDLIVSMDRDSPAVVASIRRIIHETDPRATIGTVMPLAEQIVQQSAQRRLETWLMTTFAVVAVMLAAIGLYGVIHYSVAQRRRDIGIRMALGANRWRVIREVMLSGLSVAAIGVASGLLLGLAAARSLEHLAFGVSVYDPATLGYVALLMLAIAGGATLAPALRASRIDPAIALRAD